MQLLPVQAGKGSEEVNDQDMVKVPRELLSDLAESVECEVEARYGSTKDHPALARKYASDLEPARQARAILAQPVADEQAEQRQVAQKILDLILEECRYWHGRDEARRGGYAILYAAAKEVAASATPIAQAAPQPEQSGLVEQQPVGYATQSDLNWQGDIVARRYRTEHYTVPLYTLSAQGDDT